MRAIHYSSQTRVREEERGWFVGDGSRYDWGRERKVVEVGGRGRKVKRQELSSVGEISSSSSW